jgi:hypothetical protein
MLAIDTTLALYFFHFLIIEHYQENVNQKKIVKNQSLSLVMHLKKVVLNQRLSDFATNTLLFCVGFAFFFNNPLVDLGIGVVL